MGKNRVGKKHRKKRVLRAASAGNADPMERIFGEAEIVRQSKIQHAGSIRRDGRADCMRFASPAEAT